MQRSFVLFRDYLKSSYLLIAAAFVFYYYSTQTLMMYANFFGTQNAKTIPGLFFFSSYNLCWFFVLPAAFHFFIRREKLKEMGIAFPHNIKIAVMLIVAALSFLLPFMIFFSTQYAFQDYSMGAMPVATFIFSVTVFFPLYYIGEECFFRGFLFLGLWKRIGWHSFWITDVLFTLFHLGKPWPEVWLCIPASIILNGLTLLTRSMVPAIIVHSMMGITLSTFGDVQVLRSRISSSC